MLTSLLVMLLNCLHFVFVIRCVFRCVQCH
jgi:hypothetical protein